MACNDKNIALTRWQNLRLIGAKNYAKKKLSGFKGLKLANRSKISITKIPLMVAGYIVTRVLLMTKVCFKVLVVRLFLTHWT